MEGSNMKLGQAVPCEVEPKKLSKDVEKMRAIQGEIEYVIETIGCELFGYPAKVKEESIKLAGITESVTQILEQSERNLKMLYMIRERL